MISFWLKALIPIGLLLVYALWLWWALSHAPLDTDLPQTIDRKNPRVELTIEETI